MTVCLLCSVFMSQTALNSGSLSSSRDLFHWDLAYYLPTYLYSSFPYYHSSFFPPFTHLPFLLSLLPFLTPSFTFSLLPVTVSTFTPRKQPPESFFFFKSLFNPYLLDDKSRSPPLQPLFVCLLQYQLLG